MANYQNLPDEAFDFQNPQQKMPVSILMEITSMYKHTTPNFELLASEGEDHESAFIYRVTVHDLSVKGDPGKTKKVAKHNAAKKFLHTIIERNRQDEWGLGKTAGEASLYLDLILADHSGQQCVENGQIFADVEKDNPIGKLQEFSSRKRGLIPIYDVIDESGMPHEKIFVVKLRLGNFEQIGKHKTKQGAKHDAARKMLNFINDADKQSRLDELAIEENDENEDIATSCNRNLVEVEELFTNGNSASVASLPVQTRNNNSLAELMNLDLDSEIPSFGLMNLFDSIGREENLNVEYILLPQRRKNGDYQCLVKFSKSAVCAGFGRTEMEAKLSAAYSSLQYLKHVN